MISSRLSGILDWIDANVLADVGCDHAHIATQAVLTGKAAKAYAMDVAKGPLENAIKTIKANGLEDSVIPILSNGLEKLPSDTDEVLIAGMGGRLIVDILGKKDLPDSTKLLLSAHRDQPLVRAWLLANGWKIEKEKMMEEDGHFYPLLLASKGSQSADEAAIELGIDMQKDETYLRYLHFLQDKYQVILKKTDSPAIQKKLDQIRERLDSITENEADS